MQALSSHEHSNATTQRNAQQWLHWWKNRPLSPGAILTYLASMISPMNGWIPLRRFNFPKFWS